jgi:hypothetical protein
MYPCARSAYDRFLALLARPKADLERVLWVDMIRSPSRQRTAAICALRPSIAPSSSGHRRKRAIEF